MCTTYHTTYVYHTNLFLERFNGGYQRDREEEAQGGSRWDDANQGASTPQGEKTYS